MIFSLLYLASVPIVPLIDIKIDVLSNRLSSLLKASNATFFVSAVTETLLSTKLLPLIK